MFLLYIQYKSRNFGSYPQSKLSVTQRQGRYSAVKSSHPSWAGQYKKCVQNGLQFTSEYSEMRRSYSFLSDIIYYMIYLIYVDLLHFIS